MNIREELEKAKIASKKDFLNYKNNILPRLQSKKIKENYSAESKSIFVGEYGYPNVNLGILSTEKYNHNDDSKVWIDNKWQISDIARARIDLINSKRKQQVKQSSEYLSEAQEIALTKKPTDVEINLERVPRVDVSFSNFHMPMGPSAELKNFKITENTQIPTAVENIVGDKDLKANEGLDSLYKKGFEKDYLVQAFSSGSLGKERKLVPTKWSITAVDDTIGKKIISEIKDYQQTGNIAFTGSYLGNYFIVLLLDGQFSYELFEFFRDAEECTTDFEDFNGRKKYAEQTAGGYYAARISVLEKLKEMKRQSSALVIRFITDEYYMPLGVWVVRNAVKETMLNKMEFGSEDLMMDFAIKLAKKKFNRDISWIKIKSKLLINRRQKKTIFDFEKK